MDRKTGLVWHRCLQHRETELPKPNLIGVGAARSGTTSLFQILRRCNDIYMSPVKETGYFASNYDRWSERDYLMFFHGSEEYAWRGEISPHYLGHPEAPRRIAQLSPDALILIQLRDPVERTISHFKKHAPAHKFDDINEYFRVAIDADQKQQVPKPWAHPVHNLRQSIYLKGVQQYAATFPSEQIHVIFLDDLKADPARALSNLTEALGVDPPIEIDRRVNQSSSSSTRSDEIRPELRSELTELFAADWRETCALFNRDPSEFST